MSSIMVIHHPGGVQYQVISPPLYHDKEIQRSLGFDRNTFRKYVRLAQSVGITRGTPLPPESELVERIKAKVDSSTLKMTQALNQISPHRQ